MSLVVYIEISTSAILLCAPCMGMELMGRMMKSPMGTELLTGKRDRIILNSTQATKRQVLVDKILFVGSDGGVTYRQTRTGVKPLCRR